MSNEGHIYQSDQRRPEYTIELTGNIDTELNPVISPTASYHLNGKLHSLLTALVDHSVTQKTSLTFFISDHPYISNFSIKDCDLSPNDALTKAQHLGLRWVEKCKEENKALFHKLSLAGIDFTFNTACEFYKNHQDILEILTRIANYLIGVKNIHELISYIPRNDEQLALPQHSAQKAIVVAVSKRYRKIKHDEQLNVLCAKDEYIIKSTIGRLLEETLYMLFWQLIGRKNICYPMSEDKDSISVFNVFDVVLDNFHTLASKVSQPPEFVSLKDEFSRIAKEKGYPCTFQNRLKICDVKYTKVSLSPKRENARSHSSSNHPQAVQQPTAAYSIRDASAAAHTDETYLLSTSAPAAAVAAPMRMSSQSRKEASSSWPQASNLTEIDPAFLQLLTQAAGCADRILTPAAADNTVELLLAFRRRKTGDPYLSQENGIKDTTSQTQVGAPRSAHSFFPPDPLTTTKPPLLVSEHQNSAPTSSLITAPKSTAT